MKKLAALTFAIVLGLGVAAIATAARNSAGTYSLPLGPVVSGTPVSSSWANTTLNDIKNEMTNSLDRNGRGAMFQPLQLSNGTVSAPSLTFGSDTNTGIYRVSADDVAMCAGGAKSQEWTGTNTTISLPAVATKGVTVTQATADTAGFSATGNGTAAGAAFYGGVTSGVGAEFSNGVASSATVAKNAASMVNGMLNFSTVTAANKDVAFTNQLTPNNFIKGWAAVNSSGAGTTVVTLTDGFNVTSAVRAVVGGNACITVTWASTFADTPASCTTNCSYAAFVMDDDASGGLATVQARARTTTTICASTGTRGNMDGGNNTNYFIQVVGRQ